MVMEIQAFNVKSAFTIVVVLVYVYSLFTGQRRTLSIEQSAHVSLWQLAYFINGCIRTCLGVSIDIIHLFLLSTEFAACWKPPSRDNHRKASKNVAT